MTDTLTGTKDLDALVPPPLSVKLAGQVFTVPGDMPMEIYLRLQAATSVDVDSADAEDEHKAVLQLRTAFTDLLTWDSDDEAERERIYALSGRYGVKTLLTFLNGIYEAEEAEAEAEEAEAGNSPEAPTESTPTTTGVSSSEASPTPSSVDEPQE